jgi:septal ring factor EnvC (AmiA/AmiB activator)
MGSQQVVPTGPPTKQDLDDAYSDLLDDLNDAYWAASTMDAKDQLYGWSELVTNLVTQLDATDLSSRDPAYEALVSQIASVNKQLDTLQKEINSLINRINTAAKIVADVAKVASIAAKVVPVV